MDIDGYGSRRGPRSASERRSPASPIRKLSRLEIERLYPGVRVTAPEQGRVMRMRMWKPKPLRKSTSKWRPSKPKPKAED